MDCKRIMMLAVLLLAAACSQRYELDLPLALNRTEMRFNSSGNTYYVLIYSNGPWEAYLEKDVPWVSLSRTEGSGNSQIMVSADLNTGVSRGVTLFVENSTGVKEMYISQEGAGSEVGNFVLLREKVEMLRKAATGRVLVGTDLDDDTLSGVRDTVVYATKGENWIHDIEVTSKRVTFRVDENSTGADREATVQLTFPLARWDNPVKAFFKVSQSMNEPAEITVGLSAIDGKNISWDEGERLLLLDSDGSTTMSAEVSVASGPSATLLYNADALQSGILGGVYPEDYVSRWSGGKIFIQLPEVQPVVSSLAKAKDLVVLAGKKDGGELTFSGACALLKLNLKGSGTLKQLSISAENPIAGDGTIDMGLEKAVYAPDSGSSTVISLEIPSSGLSLPAELYLAVPQGDLGDLLINATTDSWSGCVSSRAESEGVANAVVPLSELSFTLPSGATNLTDGSKWSNCFLVENSEETICSIDISRPDGKVPADDITRCTILWQTAPGVVDYLAVDAAAKKLYFRKAASKSGNVLVAVMNDAGTVRWSYHIWAPAEPVETRKIGSFTFMDRNLGAIKAAAADNSNASIGTHYQWGRKDPFPPAVGTKTSGNGMRSKVYPDNILFVTAQDGVSQAVADATPNTYYWGSGASGKQDWRDEQDDNLWASEKSTANPCPYGWKVASNDALGLLPERLKEAEYVAAVGITIKDDEGKSMLFVPGGAYRRSVSKDSELANMSDGWIWSSTPMDMPPYRGSYRLWYQSNTNNRRIDSTYPQRRWGGNVRCIKVQ